MVDPLPKVSIKNLPEFLYANCVQDNHLVGMVGRVGTGKSSAIAQLVAKLDAEFKAGSLVLPEHNYKGCQLVDKRLTSCLAVDLRGVPDLSGDWASWKSPDDWPLEGNLKFDRDILYVVFVDEYTSVSDRSVHAACQELFLDRSLSGKPLGQNTRLIWAGNMGDDRAIVNSIPSSNRNRSIQIETYNTVEDWLEYILDNCEKPNRYGVVMGREIAESAWAYHTWKNKHEKQALHTFDPKDKEQIVFATHRSWEAALIAMRDTTRPLWVRQSAASGLIGSDQAILFLEFMKLKDTIVDIKAILADPLGAPLPDKKKMDHVYVTALTCSGNITADTADAIHAYLKRMDTIFLVMAWQLAIKRDTDAAKKAGKTGKLRTTAAYLEFCQKYAGVFTDQ